MEEKTLDRRIRDKRLKLNLTQKKLAEDVNLSMAYIGQIERGECSLPLDNLVAVTNRLGVTVDYLLSDQILEFIPVNFTNLSMFSSALAGIKSRC